MKRIHIYPLGALLLLLFVACSADAGPPPEVPPVEESARPAPDFRPDLEPLIEGAVSPDGLKAILGTADLGLGVNRVGFVLTSPDGFVTGDAVTVSSWYLGKGGSRSEERQTVRTEYQPWPYGNRGLYTARLDFDLPGTWRIDIVVENPGGPVRQARLEFEVMESLSAPPVGAPAVRSVTKTTDDVESLAQLTTGSLRDPDLYQISIADALDRGRPTVVVFASPAFCTNAVCGPQVEVLQQLKDKYADQASFIHVDFYDNPDEIQGDLKRGRISPSVLEWRLPSIEWSFVIDRDGIVTARFEAFATFDEVEEALLEVL